MRYATTLVMVKAGHLKALAVSTTERVSTLPDVPTVAEQGFPGFDMGAWLGLIAPAGRLNYSPTPYRAGKSTGKDARGNANRTGARDVSEATSPHFNAADKADRPVRSPKPVIWMNSPRVVGPAANKW